MHDLDEVLCALEHTDDGELGLDFCEALAVQKVSSKLHTAGKERVGDIDGVVVNGLVDEAKVYVKRPNTFSNDRVAIMRK